MKSLPLAGSAQLAAGLDFRATGLDLRANLRRGAALSEERFLEGLAMVRCFILPLRVRRGRAKTLGCKKRNLILTHLLIFRRQLANRPQIQLAGAEHRNPCHLFEDFRNPEIR